MKILREIFLAAALTLALSGALLSAVAEQVEAGDMITFGRYEQDNDLSNGSEPIEWRVLAVDDGKALVVSEYGLDAKAYNWDREATTWETCSLRKWLNGTFYDAAFSEQEKQRIVANTLENSYYGVSDPKLDEEQNETTDNVFLLSVDEVERYFSNTTDDYGYPSKRAAKPTAYAVAQQVWIHQNAVWARVNEEEYPEYEGNCWYWLRTGGSRPNMACNVCSVGGIFVPGVIVSYANGAVRPALFLSI